MRWLTLPALGPRGEGWFAAQIAIFALILAAAGFGPQWGGDARAATTAAVALTASAGALLALRGFVDLRENLTPFPRPLEGGRLVDTGSYALVRHPIYGGLVLGAAGWALLAASLPALGGAALLLAFFDLKSRREEAWLAERYAGYAAYRGRTHKLLPWIY